MAARPAFELVPCSHCQALADAVAGQCWLCGERLEAGRSEAAPRPVRRRANSAQQDAHEAFQLSSFMIWVVVCVVLVGLFLIAPGLSIPIAIFAIPALSRIAGKESIGGKLLAVVSTVILVVFGIFVALFIVCLAIVSTANFH